MKCLKIQNRWSAWQSIVAGLIIIANSACSGGSEFTGTATSHKIPPVVKGEGDAKPAIDVEGDTGRIPGREKLLPIDIDETADGTADDLQLSEEELQALPGTVVAQVALNFENGSDGDHNDLVYCFTGAFKINGFQVVSLKEQSVGILIRNGYNGANGWAYRAKASFQNTEEQANEINGRISYNQPRTVTLQVKAGQIIEAWSLNGSPSNHAYLTKGAHQRVQSPNSQCRNYGG